MENTLTNKPPKPESAGNFLVQFDGVTLRVAGKDCFRNTRWNIRPGEHWAIAGANGAGKSTLLQAILGQVPVSKGEILYQLGDGTEFPGWGYPEGAIGYVSQDEHRALIRSVLTFHQARWTPFDEHPPVLVKEVISEGKYRLSSAPLREVLDALNIGHLLERSVESLSNGEVRKTLLARALASEPKMLLLDDPYEGLDTASRRNLKALLHWVMRRGTSIVMTLQRPEENPRGITHLLCVERRRIAAFGPKKLILESGVLERCTTPRRRAFDFSRITSFRRACAVPVNPEPCVEIRNAFVVYDNASILRAVDWTIYPGQKWVLRGPNGSGKSTLASLILGDNPQAYSNHVRVFGWLRGHGESLWEIKEKIGWIAPELHYHYDESATCREVVASGLYDTVGLYQDGSAGEARQVRRWMRALRIGGLEHTLFGAISDGQQRCVLMARALVKEPPLLILDEPCQGLDQAHRAAMYALLERLAQQPNATIIYITHHTDEIPASFTHELHLKAGRVARCGHRKRMTRP